MIRRLIFLTALAVAIISAALFYRSASISSRSGADAALYSVRRYDPYGSAALRDLLQERGFRVQTLENPHLPTSDHAVLIQSLRISDWRGSRYEIPPQRLLEWMRDGNTVIQFTRDTTALMSQLKIGPSTAPASAPSRKQDDRQDAEAYELRGESPHETPAKVVIAYFESPAPRTTPQNSLHSLLLWSPMTIPDPLSSSWKPIAFAGGNADRVVAGEMTVGRGKLIVVGAPTPVLNSTLGSRGNLDFLLSQIGDSPVILDEWSHGIGHRPTVIGFIGEVGLAPLLLQIVFIAALYIWSTIGYPQQDSQPPARKRSSIEQIQTLGFLYARSFNPEVTFEHVHDEVTRRLAAAMRCPPADVGSRVKLLTPPLRQKCNELLEQLSRLGPSHGPRCLSCGYDLYLLTSDRCPECGSAVGPELRARIAEASRGAPAGAGERRQAHLESEFAKTLTVSHQLSLEVQRERRAL